MLGTSITRHVGAAARRFVGANEGNIAMIFAAALVPLLSFVGAAIDYSRANAARSSMQAAMDSAALMVSKDLSSNVITPSQVAASAQAYFTALYTNTDAKSVIINATYTVANGSLGSTVQITGSGSVTTDFMKVIGFQNLNFNTSSTAAWGNVKMRVALALDNTGSMGQDGKIQALRNAVAGTGGLIDQLSALVKNPGDVYISVVPFAKVVNAGSSNYSQNWIDWTDWANPPTTQPNNGSTQATLPMNWHAVGPGSVCPFTNSSGGFVCTTGPVNASATATTNSRNVIPSSGTYSGYICPSVDANSHTAYNGCWDSVATNPASAVFCSGNSSCSCPINSSGNSVSGCSCTGSGSSKSCTGLTYTHHWTQPSVVAPVGFTSNKWTSSNTTPTVANVWTAASTNPMTTWTGCITDRTQPYDAQNDTPTAGTTATLFPANQYLENSEAYCATNNTPPLQQIVPMSTSWSSLKATVNAMQPTGGTDQSVGLAWAWETLLTTGPTPFNAPAEDPSYTYNRVIILLSDGLNTEDRWPANGDGSTQNVNAQNVGLIDVRQALQCQNIKNPIDPKTGLPMYTIYTIQVNTSSPADPTSTVLQNCASSPDKFFMLTSSSQIVTTFTTIGTQLSQLRVAR